MPRPKKDGPWVGHIRVSEFHHQLVQIVQEKLGMTHDTNQNNIRLMAGETLVATIRRPTRQGAHILLSKFDPDKSTVMSLATVQGSEDLRKRSEGWYWFGPTVAQTVVVLRRHAQDLGAKFTTPEEAPEAAPPAKAAKAKTPKAVKAKPQKTAPIHPGVGGDRSLEKAAPKKAAKPAPAKPAPAKTGKALPEEAIRMKGALAKTGGNVRQACGLLGINSATFYRRLGRFGLSLEDLK